jgi:predicted phage tail protein
VSGIYQGARVVWVNPTDADLAFVEVYEFTASTPVPNAGSAASARIYGTDYVRQGLAAGAVRFYWVRAVDASGNKSAWAGGTSATASAVDIPAASITSTQIADNSISTPKLQANSITAAKVGTNEIIATSANIANSVITTAKIGDAQITSAKIGDAQISTAKIGDLNVTTLKIADNAVTVPVSAYTAGVYTGGGASQTITITATGAPIFILASASVTGASAGSEDPNPVSTGIELKMDGVTIAELTGLYSGYVGSSGSWVALSIPASIQFSHTPSAGTHTYTLHGGVETKQRAIFALQTKK